MDASGGIAPEEFLDGNPLAAAVFERVRAILEPLGPVSIRVSKSQIAFRRRRGFAFIWRPSQYLGDRGVDAVLSIALGRHDGSPRFKQVAHPSPLHWIHHLEIHDPRDVDEEVAGWLAEAAERAG